MTSRIIRQVDQASRFANVCTAFSVSAGETKALSYANILRALALTVEFIPVLNCIINHDAIVYEKSTLSLEARLTYVEEPTPLPRGEAVALQLVEESRRLADLTKSLFALRAVQHNNYLMFYLVINHTIVDGPSIFTVVDVFLQHLAAQIDDAFLVSAQPVPDRDIIGEVLANLLSSTEPSEDSLLRNAPSNMLTFPALTDANSDVTNNGCVRVIYSELNAEVTASILQACRKNRVSFQALLSSASALAFVKLLHSTGTLDWNAPIVQMTPANLRRYLAPSGDKQSVDAVVAMGAAFLRWQMQPLQSSEALSARLFWSEFVHSDAHRPILDTVNSPYLLQSVHAGESQSVPYAQQSYSITSTSLGCLPAVRTHYGVLSVQDIHMHAGIWATTQEQFDHPCVPAGLINSGAPGIALMHAYTVFGRLKLTGEFYAYSEEFIQPYYDEFERILVAAGSAEGCVEDATVGSMFKL